MSDITDLLGPDAPAVVAALDVDEVAYLNVGSVRSDVSRQSWRPLYELVAPPEWQMLADEQCETCGGSGDELVDSMLAVGVPGGMYPIGPCPDCHEGRPVHTINVPCRCQTTVGHPPGKHGPCNGTGTVSVDVTVRLVPVIQTLDADDPLPVFWISPTGHSWCFTTQTDSRQITPSGPPLSPGGFVAVFEKVAA